MSAKYNIVVAMTKFLEKDTIFYHGTSLRFRCAINNWAYYAGVIYNEILPEIIKISNQPRYGYHGISHTEQVCLRGLECAISVGQDAMPVIVAAGLHDCARTNDGDCLMHGPKCVPVAQRFIQDNYSSLFDFATKRQIVNAVKNHSVGMVAPDLVSGCLWDADRIRLSWECGYDKRFFTTSYANKIAALNPSGQAEYKRRQENMLVRHNIKTREEIEYDKLQNEQSLLTKSKFNIRLK